MGLMQFLEKIFGGKTARDYKKMRPVMETVKEVRGQYADLDDESLRGMTDKFLPFREDHELIYRELLDITRPRHLAALAEPIRAQRSTAAPRR